MKLALILGLILVTVVNVVGCEKETSPMPVTPQNATDSQYRSGQEWSFRAPTDQPNARLIILRVDPAPQDRKIVHIAITGLRIPNPRTASGFQETIPHMPYFEEAIDRSVTELLRENAPLPHYEDAYNEWRRAFDAGKAGAFAISVAEGFDVINKALKQAK